MEISQASHDVENQAPPLVPYNVFEADLALREALEREGGGWGVDRLRDTGELAGTAEALAHSERAERNEPILRTHDRYGNRIDEVELDPSWHWCLRQPSSVRSTRFPGGTPSRARTRCVPRSSSSGAR